MASVVVFAIIPIGTFGARHEAEVPPNISNNFGEVSHSGAFTSRLSAVSKVVESGNKVPRCSPLISRTFVCKVPDPVKQTRLDSVSPKSKTMRSMPDTAIPEGKVSVTLSGEVEVILIVISSTAAQSGSMGFPKISVHANEDQFSDSESKVVAKKRGEFANPRCKLPSITANCHVPPSPGSCIPLNVGAIVPVYPSIKTKSAEGLSL